MFRDRFLYLVACIALATAFAVAPLSGTHPDIGVIASVGGPIVQTILVLTLCAMLLEVCRLAFVEKAPRPARQLVAWCGRRLIASGTAANAASTVSVFLVFASGFAILKGAIAAMAPFSWDIALREADRAIHFGKLPHEWLLDYLGSPAVLWALNFAYNSWFFLAIGSIIAVALRARDQHLRHQYLMSFLATWLVGGFFVALGFSSAGPCFFERAGFGDIYSPLMQTLQEASRRYPLWALSTQDDLWAGFSGLRDGSVGISAFPSIHVATAVLMALGAWRIHRLFGIAMWIFAAVILLGSVLLAWHYAVDGYAGGLIALAIWRLSGNYAARIAPPA